MAVKGLGILRTNRGTPQQTLEQRAPTLHGKHEALKQTNKLKMNLTSMNQLNLS